MKLPLPQPQTSLGHCHVYNFSFYCKCPFIIAIYIHNTHMHTLKSADIWLQNICGSMDFKFAACWTCTQHSKQETTKCASCTRRCRVTKKPPQHEPQCQITRMQAFTDTITILVTLKNFKLECGPMPNVMAALPNIGGALCSTPQSLADAHY